MRLTNLSKLRPNRCEKKFNLYRLERMRGIFPRFCFSRLGDEARPESSQAWWDRVEGLAVNEKKENGSQGDDPLRYQSAIG